MPARNAYQCTQCDTIHDFIGEPMGPCLCGGTWRLIFNEVPQIRTEHAATVDEVIRRNNALMAEKHEEAMSPGTEQYQEIQDLRYGIHDHIPDAHG